MEKKLKITFFSADPGNHKFITPIIERLQIEGHDCQLLNNWTYTDADIYWFDFCDNNLIVATRDDKEELKKKKVIARLHAVEYYMGFHNQIDWNCVDHLIFVSDHMRRMCFNGIFPGSYSSGMKPEIHTIHNGIDLEKFNFKNRKKGNVIGYAGNIVPTKGILTMLNYFAELTLNRPWFKLKMVGLNRFHGREGEYFKHCIETNGMKDKIEETGEVPDINEWLEGIDYLWQPSLTESFSIIVGEAMAKGIKPIINDFYGSRELWPEDCIYRNFTEFLNIIDGIYISDKYREFVERYSLDKSINKINEIIKQK